MCMKNVNTDILFFEDVSSYDNDKSIINLHSASKGIPEISVKYLDSKKEVLVIDNLQFIFSVNANELIENDMPFHKSDENPDNTIFFNEKYEILFRITETHSGRFFDLDGGPVIDPSNDTDKVVRLCRSMYMDKIAYKYQNILVAAPPEGKHLCVLKVLIRRKTVQPDDTVSVWVVQSTHPIKLNLVNED